MNINIFSFFLKRNELPYMTLGDIINIKVFLYDIVNLGLNAGHRCRSLYNKAALNTIKANTKVLLAYS